MGNLRCCFIIAWITATITGFILSLLLLTVGEKPDLGLWDGFLGGGIVGLFQGLVLMRYRQGGSWWILANTLVWSMAGASSIGVIGWFIPSGSPDLFFRAMYGVWDGLKIGIISGFVQWLALKRTVHKFSISWIAWNTIAWMVGLAFGRVIGAFLHQTTNRFNGEIVGLTVTWIVVGFIEGLILNYLLRQTIRQAFEIAPVIKNDRNRKRFPQFVLVVFLIPFLGLNLLSCVGVYTLTHFRSSEHLGLGLPRPTTSKLPTDIGLKYEVHKISINRNEWLGNLEEKIY